MAEGAPKPKTPSRFIATACTVVIAIAATIAALAGFAFYKISKGMDEVAAIGSDWLARQSEANDEFGGIQRIDRIPGAFNMQIRNDEGDAWFEYKVVGGKATGEARVSMLRRRGDWRAVSARLKIAGRDIPIGTPP